MNHVIPQNEDKHCGTKGNDSLDMPRKFNFTMAIFECTNGIRTNHNGKPIQDMACTPFPIPMPIVCGNKIRAYRREIEQSNCNAK